MDLVPDSAGRDGSGSDGFPFRNVNAGSGHSPTPLNGAAHRAAERRSSERHSAERHAAEQVDDTDALDQIAAQAAGDPTIAEHPLVQGLLLELPDRDSPLPDGWLDHWLEAARAVLELLYSQRPAGLPR
jgi:hypothetical protein